MRIGFESAKCLSISNEFDFHPDLPDLPRVGLVMITKAGFENLEWFGRGSWENYIDRNSAPVGMYSGQVKDQFVPYILPQENGNKTDVRWMRLDRGDLSFTVSGRFEFSVSHFTADELERCLHTNELQPIEGTVLTLDLRQRGLGTASCGPDTLEKYKIQPGKYLFEFLLS